MKKILTIIVSVILLTAFSSHTAAEGRHEDYRIIKKAVKKNSHPEHRQEVKWFKLQVRDLWDGQDKIRLTLPISFIEGLLACAGEKDLGIDCEGYDLNIREWFEDLKEAGPLSLIEIRADGVLVRIWLE